LSASVVFLVLGALLSVSILVDTIARRTALPRISLLILTGVAYAAIDQLVLGHAHTPPLGDMGEPLINLALVMVAFLLGSELTVKRLVQIGPAVALLSLAVMIISILVVGAGLLVTGFSLSVAVVLAAISVATDPAAVSESVWRSRSHNLRSRIILGVVAIDDVWGIAAFTLAMAFLSWHLPGGESNALLGSLWELGGAVAIGGLLGLAASWLTGRLRPGEPVLVEALALMFLIVGLSEWLGISPLLTGITTGAVIVNLSAHHTRSFAEIEHIEWPFLVFFFVLCGASVDFAHLDSAGWLVLGYILFRLVGRYLGGYLGRSLLSPGIKRSLPPSVGLAFTPQAGVAMGMALLAAENFGQQGSLVVTTVVVSTVVFEFIGPFLLRQVLGEKAGR
jgi:Kef-type K+ transport system membrane component KefB